MVYLAIVVGTGWLQPGAFRLVLLYPVVDRGDGESADQSDVHQRLFLINILHLCSLCSLSLDAPATLFLPSPKSTVTTPSQNKH